MELGALLDGQKPHASTETGTWSMLSKHVWDEWMPHRILPRLPPHPSYEMVSYRQTQTENKVVTYSYYGSGLKPKSLLRTLIIQGLKVIFPHPRLDPQIRTSPNFPQAGPVGGQERGPEKASWHSWCVGCGKRREDLCPCDRHLNGLGRFHYSVVLKFGPCISKSACSC